jgi:Tfp pilus assembly protein FimV
MKSTPLPFFHNHLTAFIYSYLLSKVTDTSYEMQPSDSLWSIAQQATSQTTVEVSTYWAELLRLNRAAVTANHRLARPGTVLALPNPHLL